MPEDEEWFGDPDTHSRRSRTVALITAMTEERFRVLAETWEDDSKYERCSECGGVFCNDKIELRGVMGREPEQCFICDECGKEIALRSREYPEKDIRELMIEIRRIRGWR